MSKIKTLVKQEMILFIAAALACASMFAVPPDIGYFSYMNYPVLGILFCLMIVVMGLRRLGIFGYLSQRLLNRTKNVKLLTALLVSIVFFCSMFITNDVALIMFVPMTLEIFAGSKRHRLIFIIVMETLAANLGSMLTPIGNPQNLYIYSFYQLDMLSFFQYVLPIGAVSYAMLIGLTLFSKNSRIEIALEPKMQLRDLAKPLLYYIVLFLTCIATVLHILDYRICVLLVLAATLVADKKILAKVDYGLLLTFACFFAFVGNLDRIDAIKNALSIFLEGRVFVVSALCSQIISNVPAAMMLSPFTADVHPLLLGVNIGGLGTPVASLASLISFKLYAKSEGSAPGKYLGVFTVYNLALLLLLSAIVVWQFKIL
ncbi:MAG: anion permease [Holophagales bacterium]|nr:anion permease [Holophagales bacterium]